MHTSEILKNLRISNNLTQDEMAQRLFVTRQAISRWETGETSPNTEALKLISKTFNISINTLLDSPQQLICQCCGMPLTDDSFISREKDNSFNEDYCKWCYSDGKFLYNDLDSLLDFLTDNISNKNWSSEQVREHFSKLLPTLKHWKKDN